jgi:uncharacterized protein (DUF2147 family)
MWLFGVAPHTRGEGLVVFALFGQQSLASAPGDSISSSAQEIVSVKPTSLIAVVFTLISGSALAAEPVVGSWKTENGEISVIDRCGASYCIVAKSGQYAGQKIGSFTKSDETYTGRITDPRNKATYSGKLTVEGDSLKLRGCATDVLCKTQTWTRQK